MRWRSLTYEARWSNDLVFKLLNAVEDNPEIRQGLYPGTGANASTAKGGGKPKTEFYWQLAVHLFADHEEYSAVFAGARESSSKKARDLWGLKVKNQLNRCTTGLMTGFVITHANTPSSMANEVKKHDKTMGETGQGMMSEEEITPNTPLARSWGERLRTT
jgi:hypothetical protein